MLDLVSQDLLLQKYCPFKSIYEILALISAEQCQCKSHFSSCFLHFFFCIAMAISSTDDISPVRGSFSSLSSAKLKQQKKLVLFKKKKKLGPTNKRLIRMTPVKLTAKKTLQEAVDETRKQATANTRKLQQSSYSQPDMNSPAMLRAKEVQSKLPPEYPSFVKFMLKSHVCRGFWLSFPKSFCDMHMPKQEETFWLIGEDVEEEEEHRAKYLVEKNGLSGGWRGFSIAHKLVAGDVLVFHLIESRKFKVYIVRASERAEIDGAIGLLDLHSQAKTVDYNAHSEDEYEDVKNVIQMITADKYLKPRDHETQSQQNNSTGNSFDSEPAATSQETGNDLNSEPAATSQETGNGLNSEPAAILQETGKGLDSEPVATLQETENESDDLESIRLAKSVLEFKDIKGFDSFNIIIDGLIIDSEIPIHLRYKYYELCCNQKKILHDDLVKGLNFKLAAGIISETVNIADAIKAAKFTASLEHLQSWDKTLKAFEEMGMRVGFVRTRLNKLICLLYEQQEIIRSKKLEQAQLEEEIRDLEGKLSKHCEAKKTVDAEIVALMVKDLSVEISFKNIANAAW